MPSSSRVEQTETGLAFHGRIDHQTIPGLIDRMPVTTLARAELDLSACRKIDSAGLALLIHWGNQHQSPGEKVSLRGASLQTRQLIEIMGLESFFELLA